MCLCAFGSWFSWLLFARVKGANFVFFIQYEFFDLVFYSWCIIIYIEFMNHQFTASCLERCISFTSFSSFLNSGLTGLTHLDLFGARISDAGTNCLRRMLKYFPVALTICCILFLWQVIYLQNLSLLRCYAIVIPCPQSYLRNMHFHALTSWLCMWKLSCMGFDNIVLFCSIL